MAINTSILDLKLDVLRLKLTYQENPAFLQKSTENLLAKVELYKSLWLGINESIKEVENVHKEIEFAIADMSFLQKNISKRAQYQSLSSGENTFRIDERNKDNTNKMVEDAKVVAMKVENALSKDEGDDSSIIYWKDETGEHCYYTNELIVSKG